MAKNLSELLGSFDYISVEGDGKTGCILSSDCVISNLAFDSRDVSVGSLFFALPLTHTTGNIFMVKFTLVPGSIISPSVRPSM